MKILIILSLSLNPMLAWSADGGGGDAGDTVKPLMLPSITGGGADALACGEAIATYNGTVTDCINASSTASHMCMANTSPKIHMGIVAVGGLMAGIAMMKSMQDSCNKFNDAMKVGQLALTAYTTSCSIVQARCDSACGISAKALAAVKSTCLTSPPPSLPAATTNLTVVTGKCEGYKTSMMVAGAGIMSMLQQSGLMGKCEKAVAAVDCAKDPTNKECPQAMDCTKAANAGNAVCICKVNPSAPGCGGAMANNNNNAPVGNAGRPTAADLGAGDIGNYTPTGSSDGLISPTGGSTAGGASLGGGAGSGGGGGGAGGGSGSAKEKDAAKKAGLNANILGGYEGGGGGGSRGGGGSGNSGLKDFLPGGARDPNRNIAAQGLANREVTASGSKSNWEKVSDRYRDNQRSLMGP